MNVSEAWIMCKTSINAEFITHNDSSESTERIEMKFGTSFTSDKKRNGYGQIHFEFSLETFILGSSEPKKVIFRPFLYVRRPLEFKRLNIF